MTSVTIKTYPTPKILHLQLTVATVTSIAKGTWDMIAYFLSQYPALGDAGVSGYSFVFDNLTNPFGPPDTPPVSGITTSFALQDTNDPNDGLKLFAPIFAHINATWPTFTILPNVTAYASFWDWYQPNKDSMAAGSNMYVCSRLLDAKALSGDRNATRDAFQAFTGAGTATAYLVSGKGVWNAQPRGGSNAVLPAWRKAYVHASEFSETKSRPWRTGTKMISMRSRLCAVQRSRRGQGF